MDLALQENVVTLIWIIKSKKVGKTVEHAGRQVLMVLFYIARPAENDANKSAIGAIKISKNWRDIFGINVG